jgi:capsule polysaccharide export protein KpsE/RkpR
MAVALQQRWQGIQERLAAAEAAADVFCRFSALAARLDAAEQALQQQQQQVSAAQLACLRLRPCAS